MTTLDRSQGEVSHLYPHFLPDGVRFLYVRRNKDVTRSGLYIGQVGSRRTNCCSKVTSRRSTLVLATCCFFEVAPSWPSDSIRGA